MQRAQSDLIVILKWIRHVRQQTLAVEKCPVDRGQIEEMRLPLKTHNRDVTPRDAFFTRAINDEINIRDEIAAFVRSPQNVPFLRWHIDLKDRSCIAVCKSDDQAFQVLLQRVE